MAMTTDPDAFFADGCGRCARFATPDCSARRWAEGLAALRALCLGAGLAETAKWGQACYVAGGRNVAIMGALKADFRLSLFDAALLADPEGLMRPAGPNARQADTIRFDGAASVAARAPALRALLAQAKANAEAGRRAPAPPSEEAGMAEELADALDADPALAEAFAALTPGRRRSYAIALASARTEATRRARVARSRDRIMAGKGATER